MQQRRSLFALSFTLLGYLAGCERAANSTPNRPPLEPSPVAAKTSSSTPDSSLPQPVVDSLVIGDTSTSFFTGDDARQIRDVLEAQLAKDQFTSTDTASLPYGSVCDNDQYPLRGYTNADIRVAFVRPRILSISFEGGNADKKLSPALVEITRVALIQRDANGQWRGLINVTRDTLEWRLNTREAGGRWLICGMPGYSNGRNRDMSEKPRSPWRPIRFAQAERELPTIWDSKASWASLRRLADSVSKLPSAAVIEGNPEPTVPMIVKDVCPGEFCEFGEWLACDSVAVYSEARATSPIALFLGRGDRFTAVTGDVHIAQAGKIVFRRNFRVAEEGMNLLFTPADTLYPLWYSGEGFGDWYFRGKRGGGFFFFGDGSHPDEEGPSPDADWELVRAMRNEWWVKVRNSKEQQGWFVPDSRVRGTTTPGSAAECTPLAKE